MMSGVLIKIGIYGLFRLLSLFSSPPMWWALVLLGLGAVSAVLGVAFAIGQHDLKRLLAYHSVENIGIIVLGLGVGLLGRVLGRPELVVLGFGGALLHTWNHGLFKSLLFLSAGAVVHSTHTREIDRLGGLYRRMPWTGSLFLLSAVAISGLPPLNGFVSELLVYLGLFQGVGASDGRAWVAATMSLGALTLVGGLALACFAKVFGAVFLGQARSEDSAKAHDGGPLMTGPMLVLAFACVVLGVVPMVAARPLDRAISAVFAGSSAPGVAVVAPLAALGIMAAALLGTTLLSAAFYRRRLSRSTVAAGPTWDCGYAAPSARMQYTASSFAELLVGLFSWALRPTNHHTPLSEVLPGPSHFESHVDDAVLEGVGRPVTRGVVEVLRRFHFFQPSRLNLYVLYVVATVIALMLWVQGASR
jgi:formate hydrogenlyase subunit 3/multisubunit Na+/H+ antiporter MnhD subunit